jgi:hypothetical protein
MKLEVYGLIQSLLEAGGKFEDDRYVVRNGNGERHRKDGPAVILPDGTQYWYRDGVLCRDLDSFHITLNLEVSDAKLV